MKKLFMLMGVAAVSMSLVFTSCKKDEDNDPASALVGKWQNKSSSNSSDITTLELKSDRTGVRTHTYPNGSNSTTTNVDTIALWTASPEVLTMQYKGNSYASSNDYYISGEYLVLESTMYKKQ